MDKKATLERLKDISQLGIVFAALLYVLGFLTVNAFLARFGIVSFDIINARYLIAGILCLMPLSIVLWIGWHFGSKKTYLFFSSNEITERLGIYINAVFWSYVISGAFVYLYKAGAISNPYPTTKLQYQSTGKYDFAAQYLNFLEPLGALGFVLKMAANIAGVIILIICFFYLLGAVIKQFSKTSNTEAEPKKIKESKAKIKKEEKIMQKPKPKPVWIFIGRCTEAVLLALLLATFSYAYNRIRIDIFDFSSFSNFKLTQGTFFAWFFSSVAATYTLTSWVAIGVEKKLPLIKPHEAGYVLQGMIVPILASIILFGQTIFPRIPYMIGGGEPREIGLQVRDPNFLNIEQDAKLYLIGESSQFFYVVATGKLHGKALQINKEEVEFLTTKIGSGSVIPTGSGTTATPKSATGIIVPDAT